MKIRSSVTIISIYLYTVYARTKLNIGDLNETHERQNGEERHKRSTICHNADVDCSGVDTKFRTIDGTCNNKHNTVWGKSFTAQHRYLPPDYTDVDKPREAIKPQRPLPLAREISNRLFQASSMPSKFDPEYTNLLMAWGQFITHDIVNTPTEGEFNCCDSSVAVQSGDKCFIMKVPPGDERFTNCINFVRSKPIERRCGQCNGDKCFIMKVPPGDERFTNCINFVRSKPIERRCGQYPRDQINIQTPFIDGSMVYGSTKEAATVLRDGQRTHLLKSHEPGHLLPEGPNGCKNLGSGDYCQHAGDRRVNVNPQLGILHTMLLREHNRIASAFNTINTWNQERVYQETRKIIGAILQHITYNQWLPFIIGNKTMTDYGLWSNIEGYYDPYNSNINPQIRNAYAAAAGRFGHSLAKQEIGYMDKDFNAYKHFDLNETLKNGHIVIQKNGDKISDLARWIHYSAGMKADRLFEDSIRDQLFSNSDLPATNVQRGRDHGIPSYFQYRKFCNMSVDMADVGEANRKILTTLYSPHFDGIDLYAGGMSEDLIAGGLVGPTFACLIGNQFSAIKKGDYFWFERKGDQGFTQEQLKAIREVTISSLFCQNFDLKDIQMDPFRQKSDGCPFSRKLTRKTPLTPRSDPAPPQRTNNLYNCDFIRPLDLRPWVQI